MRFADRAPISKLLIDRLQLVFASSSLFLPNMKVFRMPDHLLYDPRKMKKSGIGNVLVVVEDDQVPRQGYVRSPQCQEFARCQN